MNSRLLLVVFPLLAAVGYAAPQRDLAAEAKLEAALAQKDPAAVEPFRQARVALDAGDYAKTVPLLQQVVAKVPTFDPAVRRLGVALAMAGDYPHGLQWEEKAVALNRSSENLSSLAYLLAVKKEGVAPPADLRRAQALLREARAASDKPDEFALSLAVQIALQLNDLNDARTLTAQLQQVAPDVMGTHYFSAVLAAIDGHWVKADREIRRAQALGLDDATVQRFLDSGVHSRALAWRAIGGTGWVIGAWAVGLGALCVLGWLLSRVTLRQIEHADPNVAISSGEHWLRRTYRTVLNLTGAYYYVSLPVIMLLVVLVAAAVIYGFMLAGVLPIKLLLLLVAGALATIWSMGRSLFLRVKAEDAGRALTREEAAGLWELAENVAATVGTRPVDEIRITPGTDLCVYERGTWREKMEGVAKRVLVIGAAVLNGFKQEEFRSVLAHEYGHFAHRDTAGGDVALRVRNDMMKFYLAMVEAGQATKLNVAFHFLRCYDFVFRRISHGATRLQEVLADRVAAQAYGAAAFEGGLTHAIRRGIEFDAHADSEIQAAIRAERPLHNLYAAAAGTADSVEETFQNAMNRPTTDDDTHPSPSDRFRLVRRVAAAERVPQDGWVWDLFQNPAAVQAEMMATIEKNILGHRGPRYRAFYASTLPA